LERIKEPQVRIDYRLRYRLGRGTSGSVWEAEDSHGGLAAIKFIIGHDGLTTSTLIWSLQAYRSLAHPHLVHIEDVYAEEGYVAVVMELADTSLLNVWKASMTRAHRPLPGHQVWNYLADAAQAIDFLNGRTARRDDRFSDIQFGSVRPSNMLVFAGTVKLADCGPVWPTNVPLRLHDHGPALAYAAPEVFRGRLSDWTDQYALAVSYCQLRGGRLPYTDTPEALVRTYTRPEPDLSMLPDAERPVIKRALAAVPQDRWPSCGVMMRQLRRVLK
jgi:serine/threonine protein kinase